MNSFNRDKTQPLVTPKPKNYRFIIEKQFKNSKRLQNITTDWFQEHILQIALPAVCNFT